MKKRGAVLTLPMASAVFTGTVLFSTMILDEVETDRDHASGSLPVGEVSCLAGAHACHLGGCVHTACNDCGLSPLGWDSPNLQEYV